MRFREDAIFILNLIESNNTNHYYILHDPIKWFFIRIEQYLNGSIGSTPQGQIYYKKSIKGQTTTNPKEKQILFNEIKEALNLNLI